MNSLNQTLTPVQDLGFAGLVRRLGMVTGVPFLRVSTSDYLQVVDRSSLKTPRYPIGSVRLSGMTNLTDRGSSHAMSHRGLPTLVTPDRKRYFKVHFLPRSFRFEMRILDDSAERLVETLNLLLFAQRNGWLKFSIAYGQSSFDFDPSLPDTFEVPDSTSGAADVKEYSFTTELSLNGHASLPQLLEGQVIDNIEAAAFVGDGTISGSDEAWPSQNISDKPTYSYAPQ